MLALLAAVLMQVPQEPPGVWERDSLLDAPEVRGVTFTLAYTAEVISNVHGGLRRDTGVDQLVDWVIDADLQKAVGWAGGSARINPIWLMGDGVAGDVGDLTLASNITGRGEVRLFEAWFQQSIDRVCSLRVGLLAADQEFVLTSSGTLFFNSVFGGPVFLTPNLAWPMYPVGAPGARVRVELAEGLYFQGAVYDGHPGTEQFNQTGLRIRLSDAEGMFSIVEAGGSVGGLTVKAGVFHHTAGDSTGGYGVVEQEIVDGLSVFARIGYSQEDRSFVALGIDTGITVRGLIPGRPQDVLGLGVITARISRDFAQSQPDRALWGHETVVELTYKIAIAPWWSLQPDVQYVVHPGGSTATPNAVVVGLRLDLLF
jgi:porin